MFNAEEIIELEEKWFKYKIKQKVKLCIFILLFVSASSFIAYKILIEQHVKLPVKNIAKTVIKKEKKLIDESKNKHTVKKVIVDINKTIKKIAKKEESNPYYFKLEPREQESELFSSNGFLTLNTTDKDDMLVNTNKKDIIFPISEMEEIVPTKVLKTTKPKISIDMQEVDTIAYLKDKYYSTSSIVFALMLAEEYYNNKNYKDTLRWALIANDIDAQNTKSWYWFAKSKVKLNQKKDALRALKAYLANNDSKRLNTLLHKIELGDTDD